MEISVWLLWLWKWLFRGRIGDTRPWVQAGLREVLAQGRTSLIASRWPEPHSRREKAISKATKAKR